MTVMRAWNWREWPEALPAQAVLAWGEAATQLLVRVAAMPVEQQARFRITASLDAVMLIGAENELPWVANAGYAAPHPDAPEIWLPTLWQPDVPGDLLARALVREFQRQPLLLWRSPAVVMPLDRALPVSVAVLARVNACKSGV